MYPRSDLFDRKISQSHRMYTRCDVTDSLGNLLTTLTITEGQINVAVDDSIRSRCSVTLVDPTGTLTLDNYADYLNPYGNELQIFRGLWYDDGTYEAVPCGVYGIKRVRVDESGQGLVYTIDGYDRSRAIARAKALEWSAISSGTNLVDALNLVLAQSPLYGKFTTNFPTSSAESVAVFISPGDNLWDIMNDYAQSAGYYLFFNRVGQLTIEAVPDTRTTSPVWTFKEGEGTMLLYASKQLDNEDTYNAVLATGEMLNVTGVTSQVYALYVDDSPASPTYYRGPYGVVAKVFTNQKFQDPATISNFALSELNKSLGATVSCEMTSLVHPALDVNDVITIQRARAGIATNFVIDKISLPLTHNRAMNVSLRAQRDRI